MCILFLILFFASLVLANGSFVKGTIYTVLSAVLVLAIFVVFGR